MKKRLWLTVALAVFLPFASWSAPIEESGAPDAEIGGTAEVPANAIPGLNGLQIVPSGLTQLSFNWPELSGNVPAAALQEHQEEIPAEQIAPSSTFIRTGSAQAAELANKTDTDDHESSNLAIFQADPSAEGTTAVNPGRQTEKLLKQSFESLERAFEGDSTQDVAPVPSAVRKGLIGRVRRGLHVQLKAMRHLEPQDRPILSQVRAEGDDLLNHISRDMAAGKLDPRDSIRASPEDGPRAAANRELRVGIYPVGADPFQWGHLLIGLRAIAGFGLDKVVFVLAGDDERKPLMTPADFRHPMGLAVLARFFPFFQYSSIAMGTNYDGETNLFRILGLNAGARIKAFYIVGGDHYRLKDKNGNPDTLPKLEKNLTDPTLNFDATHHSVEAIFIKREGGDEHVPTNMKVHFLPPVPFEASSSLVRSGNHALMPHAAYEYVQRHRPGLYGIPARRPSLNWRAAAPNALTLLNLSAGLAAMALASQGLFLHAAQAIASAAIFDLFDGRVARALKAKNPLGIDLDSLADVVSFGAAPALLIYKAALFPALGWLGFPIAATFAAAGAWRLARFNVSAKADADASHAAPAKKSDFFTGMPIPAGAGVISILALSLLHSPANWVIAAIITLVAAAAMVSRLPYPAFKKGGIKSLMIPIVAAAVIAASLSVFGLKFMIAPAIVGLYLLSGPLIRVLASKK